MHYPSSLGTDIGLNAAMHSRCRRWVNRDRRRCRRRVRFSSDRSRIGAPAAPIAWAIDGVRYFRVDGGGWWADGLHAPRAATWCGGWMVELWIVSPSIQLPNSGATAAFGHPLVLVGK